MPEISIIIPIYKAEKYLQKCIESVLTQTFTNFELLLIDDGSPDKCGFICDEYAKKDNRITVFHRDNGGVSNARNLGLENAKGKWITFIDADDWVDSMYLEHLLEGKEYQFATMGFKYCAKIAQKIEHEIFKDDDLYKFFERYVTTPIEGCVWAKLLLLEIINKNKIKFDSNLSFGEDNLFLFLYYKNISTICILNYFDYNKVSDCGSLSAIANFNQKSIHFSIYRENIEQLIIGYPTSNLLKENLANLHLKFVVYSLFYAINNKFNAKKRRECISHSFTLLDNLNLKNSSRLASRSFIFDYFKIAKGLTEKIILVL